MYRVQWLTSAVAKVADAWLEANADLRAAITAAVSQIGIELRDKPTVKGESRSADRRILLVAPLGVVFRVDPQEQMVTVLRAWVFRRGRRSGEGAE